MTQASHPQGDVTGLPRTHAFLITLTAIVGWLIVWWWILSPSQVEASEEHEIAILRSADITPYSQPIETFKSLMPNSTTFLEYNLQGDMTRGRKLARKIRASDASLVLAVGLKAALAAKLEVVDTPILFCMVLDPSRYDLQAPNMTGIRLEVPVERQLEALQAVLPDAHKIGVLYDPTQSNDLIQTARQTARSTDISLVERQVESDQEVPNALRELLPKIQALWLVPDSTVLTKESFRFILETTLAHGIPIYGFSEEFVRSGALLALSVSYVDVGTQAAKMAMNLLNHKGLPDTNLVPPEEVQLSLNLKTARFLGITIPPHIVSAAHELY